MNVEGNLKRSVTVLNKKGSEDAYIEAETGQMSDQNRKMQM